MKLVVIGDVSASSDHEFPVKPSYSACRIGAALGPSRCSGAIAAIAAQASNPISASSIRMQAARRHEFIVVFLVLFCLVDNCSIASSIINLVFITLRLFGQLIWFLTC